MATQTAPTKVPQSAVDRFFKITERGSSVWTELRGGSVTFITMAYIVVLNALIIGTVADSKGHFLGGGSAPNLAVVAAGTALVACIMCIMMGLFANFPLALATGLGLNAFVAFNIASVMSWQDAMGLVVLEGLFTLALVLTGFREAVLYAIPKHLKAAIAIGIGLFIAFIGLVDSGFVRPGAGTPVTLGANGELIGWPAAVFAFGLFLIAILYNRKVKGAILIGIACATVLAIIVESIGNIGAQKDATGKLVNPAGWALNVPSWPDKVFSVPHFDTVGHVSLTGAFSSDAVLAVLLIFVLFQTDFFDTMGTMTAIGKEAGLNDANGNPPRTRAILAVDSIGAAAGGFGGVSSNTSYIESASGVGEGARTGLSTVVVGALFAVATFFSPLVEIVPFEAATPALVFVGYLMVKQGVDEIDWRNLEEGLPAFATAILMPFTYSISVGVGAGFIFHVVLKATSGKGRDIHPLMWVVSVLFALYFLLDPLKDLLGVG